MKQKNLYIAFAFMFAPFIFALLVDSLRINMTVLVGTFNPYIFFGMFDIFQLIAIVFAARNIKLNGMTGGGTIIIVVAVILILLSIFAISLNGISG